MYDTKPTLRTWDHHLGTVIETPILPEGSKYINDACFEPNVYQWDLLSLRDLEPQQKLQFSAPYQDYR